MTITERTDTQLKDAIVSEMEWTPSINSEKVGVSVNHGAVTLSGEVDSYPEKFLAEQAALRVRGVHAVAEEITVRSIWTSSDTDIAREAAEALERAIDVPERGVVVEVHGGAITLSGSTHWNFQRVAAERAVKYLKGVTAVRNTIAIDPIASARDIKTAITGAFIRDAQLEGRNIKVTAAGGEVTLEGAVHSWSEWQHAESAAWSAPGVTHVTTKLHVEH
jgi:osmotically-inducible protein OsmY